MKTILLFILSITIILRSTPQIEKCNLQTAKQAIAPRIFYEQTIDGAGQSVLITRFTHNKIGIFASEASRCYFNLLDPNFIYDSVGLIGLASWLYFSYFVLIRKIWILAGLAMLVPILPFLNFSPNLVSYFDKIFAIIGLVIFFGLPQKKS